MIAKEATHNLWRSNGVGSRRRALHIVDLGTLSGDILLFGGVYSNLQALEALMNWADEAKIPIQNRICTGDVVAYCADAAASFSILHQARVPMIAGNCEQQLALDALDCGCGFEEGSTCDRLSAGWFQHANAVINASTRAQMGALPAWITFMHEGRRYAVVHGGASSVNAFLWPSDDEAVFELEIKVLQGVVGKVDGVICGHSGLAFSRDIGAVKWINAGAIGMPPHDGRMETRFAVLSAGDVRIERLSYDAEGAHAAMVAAGLTQGYHTALLSGIWPSEDILPTALRR